MWLVRPVVVYVLANSASAIAPKQIRPNRILYYSLSLEANESGGEGRTPGLSLLSFCNPQSNPKVVNSAFDLLVDTQAVNPVLAPMCLVGIAYVRSQRASAERVRRKEHGTPTPRYLSLVDRGIRSPEPNPFHPGSGRRSCRKGRKVPSWTVARRI